MAASAFGIPNAAAAADARPVVRTDRREVHLFKIIHTFFLKEFTEKMYLVDAHGKIDDIRRYIATLFITDIGLTQKLYRETLLSFGHPLC
jgi:hypothetical protein